MATRLQLEILPQPDDTTCGPTCLHAVYRYYGDDVPLDVVIREAPQLEEGGTLAVLLACHALRRGYRAIIYTYNLQVFDPTWFFPNKVDLRERLAAQAERKASAKLREASCAYVEFLNLGGRVLFEDLTPILLRKYLNRGAPILTGLNATYLYHSARERVDGSALVRDDIGGEPTGHFVVLHGYDKTTRQVMLADPIFPNPVSPTPMYPVTMNRLLCAITLGILTYDANLLIIRPRKRGKGMR